MNRDLYGGYKQEKVNPTLRARYEMLSKQEQRRLKKESKELLATKYEYLEEIEIDCYKAEEIATGVILNKKLTGITVEDLSLLILFCGMGVQRRTSGELVYILAYKLDKLEKIRESLLVRYGNQLDSIYDIVLNYISNEKGCEKKYVIS